MSFSKQHLRSLPIIFLFFPFVEQAAFAQRTSRDPHLAYAYPAGLRQGTSCEIVFGGQHLEKVTAVHIAGTGIEAEIVGWYRPMTRGTYNNLRMKLDDAREQLKEQGKRTSIEDVAKAAGVTLDELREMEIFRERDSDPKRQPNDQLEEELTVRVSAAEDALPGKRELRVLTDNSMSNPLWLHLGVLPEVRETESADGSPSPITESLPVVVNGTIMPGEVDHFTFHATKGTRLVIDAGARDVIPFLADAVPGWFQAVLTLQDEHGKQVAQADSFHFRQDPAILFEVPEDGRYTVSIRDSLFRGREDFVYRMKVGGVPFLTGIFPLGARVDSEVKVELNGWNLSQDSIELKTSSRRSYRPVEWVSLPQSVGPPIEFPLQVDRLQEDFEGEPNDSRSEAHDIPTHRVINGRIDRPGDRDVYQLSCKGKVVIEVQARQHGSPLDSVIIVVDDQDKEVAFNDDHEDKSQALATHHADSQLTTVIPSGSPRYLIITDAQNKGGKEFTYRLYLRSPEPDYELRVVPSTIIASAGAVVPITVFALRKDGFSGEIQLALTDPPEGCQLEGGVIPGQAHSTRMTLKMPPTAGKTVFEMQGRARAHGGNMLVRDAVPAEYMMQAFIWYHLVPVEDWNIILNRGRAPQAPFELARSPKHVVLPLGRTSTIPARALDASVDPRNLRVELSDPPPGVTAKIITNSMGNFAVELATDAKTAPPGWKGNLILRAYSESTPNPTEDNPMPTPVIVDFGFLPAVPVEFAKRSAS